MERNIVSPINSELKGLTQAEAQQRRTDSRATDRLLAEKQFRKKQLLKRIFSIFNLKILIMVITQVLLQNLWGAVITLGTLVLIIVLGERKQSRSIRQIGELLSATRPKATVLREGLLRSVDQDDVVFGDYLVVNQGDQLMADGKIIESSGFTVSTLSKDSDRTEKFLSAGDQLRAGNFCESGWAILEVEHIPEELEGNQVNKALSQGTDVRTPLQTAIQVMLLVLLGISVIFYIILMTELLLLEVFPTELINIYRAAISVIFSIAPSGLFFMVMLNYLVGSAFIAKSGALIKYSHTIEELSQVSNLLLIRKKDLDTYTLLIDMIPDTNGAYLFSENRTRQLLGNYLHSITTLQFPFTFIKDELEGNRFPLRYHARFLSALGWEAISFRSDAMPGTYVIGQIEALQAYLKTPLNAAKETDETIQADLTPAAENKTRKSRITRLKTRTDRLQQVEGTHHIPAPDEQSDENFRLLFAYAADNVLPSRAPVQPPDGLIPICYLDLIKVQHPGMRAAFQIIQQAGIKLRILTSGQLKNLNGLAETLAIKDFSEVSAQAISGETLSKGIASNNMETILEKSIYYQHNSEQKLQVIKELKNDGQVVALHSNSTADLPLMTQSDVNITTLGSSHKLISSSDVILMNNSPLTLPMIFVRAQNIVQSVVNLLKLHLTKIGYMLLLIIVMFLTGNRRFIFEPIHGTLIGLITITLPSIFVSLWTYSLRASRERILRQLWLFISPATISITGAVVATYFLFSGRGYPFFRIQHVITHLLVLIGLLLVVFCYPPLPVPTTAGESTRDWRMTCVSVILFIFFHALTQFTALQRFMRLFPLVSLNDYLIVWSIGLVWGIVTVLLWYLTRKLTFGNQKMNKHKDD